MPDSSPIYISYAWGGESERIVDAIEAAVTAAGLTLVRDKRALDYRESIRRFMQALGRGERVIVVISDRYLRSHNCMFELLELAANRDFHQRIFPVVLRDADIYKAVNRIKYIRHWEQEIAALNESLRSLTSQADLEGVRQEIDLYTRIRAEIAGLIDVLQDMNTLTPEMHADSHFERLVAALAAAGAAAPTTPAPQARRERGAGEADAHDIVRTTIQVGSIQAAGGAAVNIAGGDIRQSGDAQGANAEALQVFTLARRLLAVKALDPLEREDVLADLQDLEDAVTQAGQPDATKLRRRLRSIQRIAPDLLDLFVAAIPAIQPGTPMAALQEIAVSMLKE